MSFVEIYGKLDSITRSYDKWIMPLFAIILCLISFRYGYIVWTTDSYVGETVTYNYPYADAIMHGIAPYSPGTGMRWEYPPFAYLLMLVPRLFTSDVYVYEVLYVVEVAIFLLIGLYLIRKIADQYGKNPFFAFVTYVVCVFMLDYFIYDRFDIIVAVIVLAALYLALKDRIYWAILLLVFGMFVKLYPALLIPLFIIPYLVKRDYVPAFKVFGFALFLSVLFIIPFMIASTGDVWNFMTYHSDRGLQIESVAASFTMFVGLFIPIDYHTDHSFGSYNIAGGVCDQIASMMMILMILALVATYLLYFIHCCNKSEDCDGRSMFMTSFLIIMVFIVFNKVFSAQYVIWAMMLLIPLFFTVGDIKISALSSISCIALMFFTMWMVKQYDSLLNHEAYGIELLFVRNVLFIAMMMFAFRRAGYSADVKRILRSETTV